MCGAKEAEQESALGIYLKKPTESRSAVLGVTRLLGEDGNLEIEVRI